LIGRNEPHTMAVMEDMKTHWQKIHTENKPGEVSWHQTLPSVSLRLIQNTKIGKDQRIIDVGGGASTLVDHLLDAGFQKLTVLDISSMSLQRAKERIGERARQVDWVEADVRRYQSKHPFSLWHDRAVFHFLTQESDRQRYRQTLKNTLAPRGHLIIATFAIGGPSKCSGLEIVQYDADTLCKCFGEGFELISAETEVHHTPWDAQQKFIYCHFQLL